MMYFIIIINETPFSPLKKNHLNVGNGYYIYPIRILWIVMVNVTTHYVGCYGCTPIRKSVMGLVMVHYGFCYDSL